MTRRKTQERLSRPQVAVISLAISVTSWIGLVYFTYAWPPDISTLPAFFPLLFVAVSASAVPFTLLIDARLRKPNTRASYWRPIRQAIWLGVWVALCSWLQLIRLLDWITALLFLVILGLIEWFIITRK